MCLSARGQDMPGWSCSRGHEGGGNDIKNSLKSQQERDRRQHCIEAALLMLMGDKTLQTAPGEKIELGFSMGRQPAPIPFICSWECLIPGGMAAPHPEALQNP